MGAQEIRQIERTPGSSHEQGAPFAESRQVLSTYLQGLFPYGAENLSEIIEETWRARGSIGVVSGIALLWGDQIMTRYLGAAGLN